MDEDKYLEELQAKVDAGEPLGWEGEGHTKTMCEEGHHKWKKLGGPVKVGGGDYKQKFICDVCGKKGYMVG